jgi:hypothetical protein
MRTLWRLSDTEIFCNTTQENENEYEDYFIIGFSYRIGFYVFIGRKFHFRGARTSSHPTGKDELCHWL